MRTLTLWLLALAVLLVASSTSTRAYADDAVPDSTDQARADFVHGVELAGKGLWGEALASFERSSKLRPHALTTYNVATCERALGAYTRARALYTKALEEDQARSGELPVTFADEARTRRAEIDSLLAHASVALEPSDATIAIDGRPLTPEGAVFVAGIAPAGPGAPSPTTRFELLLDPGVTHLITLTRKGFSTVVLNRTFAAASHGALTLVMDRLPALLRISAVQPGAVVKLDGRDIGAVPIETTRPAGAYAIEVNAAGFIPYRTSLVLLPGEEANLRAPLSRQPPAITRRWWFWAGAAVLTATVVGVGVGVFYATRSPPPPDGGGLGWAAPTH